MATLSMDAANPPCLAGEKILDVRKKGAHVLFDLGNVIVHSDPSDIYAFVPPDNFILKEDLEK